ncbi:histone-lysine N-methyltransferase SETMAR [Trichonephila clavipes]|nr:histone-lysine N-methyltransferase SETMAR [Trichonephila clavipes]
MSTSSSSVTPTPLAQADNQGEGHPRGGALTISRTHSESFCQELSFLLILYIFVLVKDGLAKFRSWDLSLQESDQSGRPSKTDNDVLRSMLENNSHLTSQEIAEEFGIHHTTVRDHIKSLGFVLKRSVWVPHELTEKNLSVSVRMCSLHLIRHTVELFLDKLITGDEKWILNENIKGKKILLQTRNISNSSKTKYPSTKSTALFVVGQERSSVLRVAETGKTINANLYCN